ncbi:MAG: maltose alpha-D-glucosyltransferase [Chloroflexota bacterium]
MEASRPNLGSDDAPWYKDALVYEVPVRSFYDGNGDGIGDLIGLAQKLDYLASLGVDCLWLLPFYPSPLRDFGYDVADFYDVHPDYGTLADFRAFLAGAHARGMRVVTDLVLNHTSDQHPWFQRARRAATAPEREFYVWSDDPTRYAGARVIFSDFEDSNWTWDPLAGRYYWHRFFRHQPDLNFDNPTVRAEMLRVAEFWLELGVDGFRCDAVPFLFECEGTPCESLPETHSYLKEVRRLIDARFPGRVLLAEANQRPSQLRAYFGEGDEFQLAFHFPLVARLLLALRTEDLRPLVDIIAQTPAIPPDCQWGLFLRNHDELSPKMVTEEEREFLLAAYAPERSMRLKTGIRRRLAPILSNGRRQLELVHSLLLSLPGTPVLYYGDEIGMGDNVYLHDRDGLRTPMQWSGDRNAGFSAADPSRLYLPAIADPVYGYQAVNVERQERTPGSFLNWLRRLLAVRRRYPAFARGDLDFVETGNDKVLAYSRRYGRQQLLVVLNLSRFVQYAALDLRRFAGHGLAEVIGSSRLPEIGHSPYPFTLGPHGFYWLELDDYQRS